jgi:hypothetical protein
MNTTSVRRSVNENEVLSPDSTGSRNTSKCARLKVTTGKTIFKNGNKCSRLIVMVKSISH